MRTATTGNNQKTLPPVRPNSGLEAAYRKKLLAVVAEMNASIEYWLIPAYVRNVPVMAQDASQSKEMQGDMHRLFKRIEKHFSELALVLALYFAYRALKRSDSALVAAMLAVGITKRFKMSRDMNNVLQSVIKENVGLITNLADEQLFQIEGLVMRSLATGGSVMQLAEELEKRFAMTVKRAAFIAQNQNAMATAAFVRIRQIELGVKDALWIYTYRSKAPRPEHLAWQKRPYAVATGKWSDKDHKYVWPGSPYNCKCLSRAILPSL